MLTAEGRNKTEMMDQGKNVCRGNMNNELRELATYTW